MIGNFGSLYNKIGVQDQKEREMSDLEDNDEEEKDDEQIQPKKKSGFLSGIFGASKAKTDKIPAMPGSVQPQSLSFSAAPNKNKKAARLGDSLSSALYQGSRMNANTFKK